MPAQLFHRRPESLVRQVASRRGGLRRLEAAVRRALSDCRPMPCLSAIVRSSLSAHARPPLFPPLFLIPYSLLFPLLSPRWWSFCLIFLLVSSGKQGRVRTKTVKRVAREIIEKYYTRLTLDFHTNKRICDEIAQIPSKKLRNKIAGFITHLMKRIQVRLTRVSRLTVQSFNRFIYRAMLTCSGNRGQPLARHVLLHTGLLPRLPRHLHKTCWGPMLCVLFKSGTLTISCVFFTTPVLCPFPSLRSFWTTCSWVRCEESPSNSRRMSVNDVTTSSQMCPSLCRATRASRSTPRPRKC